MPIKVNCLNGNPVGNNKDSSHSLIVANKSLICLLPICATREGSPTPSLQLALWVEMRQQLPSHDMLEKSIHLSAS